MKRKSWGFGIFNKKEYSRNLNQSKGMVVPTDEEIQNLCNLLKIEKFRNKLVDAFNDKTIKLDTSEWYKD
jgi:hypothetical protein